MEIQLDRMTFEAAALAEAGGWAAPGEIDALQADSLGWGQTLRRLILEADDTLRRAQSISGPEREQVLADMRQERATLIDALFRVTGEDLSSGRDASGGGATPEVPADEVEAEVMAATEPLLQASWVDGKVVVWGGGAGCPPVSSEEFQQFLRDADAASITWESHSAIPLPTGGSAEARSAPVSQTLGWLVGVGAGQLGDKVGPSLRWLGEIAVWGTELVAQGRMVPMLRSSSGTGTGTRQGTGRHRVRWAPALIDRNRLQDLVERMPGAVAVLQSQPLPDGVCRSFLTAVVDAVSRAGAERLVTPATVPLASTRVEISEAVLSGLDGRPFVAASDAAARLAEDLKRWTNPVTAATRIGLTVRLDPPEQNGGWLLNVEAIGVDKHPLPVEHALVVASSGKSQQVEAQLRRLERLLPVLRRPSTRRGQVMLDGEEAAALMFETGPILSAAGFEVLLPAVSRRRPNPRLRLFAEATAGRSQVGVAQLASVRWSVLFDDLELDAADIARLAKESRPLVRVRGRWVRIDRADLAAAAAALAERSSITELSGAAIIRHAVGLEGGALGGAAEVDGTGWAVELMQGATTNPPAPLVAPAGFVGVLRHYQEEAAGWLAFLDRAGLGGCLAMDMGLGKTPTVLAHLLSTRGDGPVLVICPPAVLSNWSAEAARFTPGLHAEVHHGPGRASPDGVVRLASHADLVLTTYATAVRDLDALARVDWRRVIIDEAQAIKNPQSDTAQTLRRLPARSRLALTGTPIENGLGDLWSILDFANPGLVGARNTFVEQLTKSGDGQGARPEESALRALNGLLIFRRTKTDPEIASELPDKVDKLDQCGMTAEQVGLYQAVVDRLVGDGLEGDSPQRNGQVLAAITALKQICDHPAAYLHDDKERLDGRSGKLTRLEELLDDVFAAGERILIFTHFARWGERLAAHLSRRTGIPIACYHGGLTRTARDQLVKSFQEGTGPGALVLSIKAGGSGLNLTAANHVVLYDRWWNPAVEDQARDRAWRIGQKNTVVSHRLVCPGTVDERVEEVVAGKRRVAGLVLPARSSLGDLNADQLRAALGLKTDELIEDEPLSETTDEEAAA